MKLTAVSLFSGIGAMDLAFALAGFDILVQVEINGFCQKVLEKHAPKYWRNATLIADVRDVSRITIPRTRYGYDVLFGGFPCQPHSVAGKRKGKDDHRDLWPEFRRIIGDIRPRAVLLENVPNITRTVGTGVIADLAALGYDATWGIISAADAGAPHLRERWWCVGYAVSQRQPEPETGQSVSDPEWQYPACERSGRTIFHETVAGAEILGDSGSVDVSRKRTLPREGTSTRPQKGQPQGADYPVTGGQYLRESRMDRAADGITNGLDGFAGFPARPMQRQFDYEPSRTLPRDKPYHVERLEALGNAVVWQCVYPLAVGIREMLEG